MKFKKIIAIVLCSMILIGSFPFPVVHAASSSESKSLINKPSFASNTGYYYDNSSVLSSMPDGGNNGQLTFNLLKHISGTPYTYTWEDVKATNVYTYALSEIIDDSNRFDPAKQEQDFLNYYDVYYLSYITYYSEYPREDYDSGGVMFAYQFYFVPKDYLRLGLYNNVVDNKIVVTYSSEGWNKIYGFTSNYYHVNKSSNGSNGPKDASSMYSSWISDSFSAPSVENCNVSFSLRSSYSAGPGQLISTNIPMFGSEAQARKYADDASGLPLNPDQDPFNSLGCDEYYFDSFDMSITENGQSSYQLVFNYDYSCSDMLENPEDYFFRIEVVQSATVDAGGLIQKYSEKYTPVYSRFLNSNDSHVYDVSCKVIESGSHQGVLFGFKVFDSIFSGITSILGSDYDSLEFNIASLNLYVTVTLCHSYLAIDGYDSVRKMFNQTSSDIRTFSYDCLTGRTFDTHSPTIKTKDVVDQDGNVVDRVLESFTWYDENYDIIYDRSYNEHTEYTDNSSGHNSTYTDNSTNTTFQTGDNSVVSNGNDNNFNWNWGTGSGSGGGGSDDGKMNLMDMLKWLTKLIEFLWAGDLDSFVSGIGGSGGTPLSGIFSVMQVFFSWLPAPIIIILIVGVLIYVACAIFNKFFSS